MTFHDRVLFYINLCDLAFFEIHRFSSETRSDEMFIQIRFSQLRVKKVSGIF